MALSPGIRFGPYEIVGGIGSGGMGEVYRATDTNLKREVAIKVLPASFVDDADRLARFQREAELLASLNHYNIAGVYGLERGEDRTALVMELVEGPTLAERLEQGPIPVDETIGIATQIAAALEAAHGQGIVHRDLKPANIKLRPNGTASVLDFGLAKTVEASPSSPGAVAAALTTPALTETGMILGTAAYMSPEQARGRAVDKRTDIWAFGALLYEMLTGQPPFLGEDVTDTVASVLKSEPDWTLLPELPPIVEAFLKQCLKKDPAKRIHDVADMRLALEGAYEVPVAPATTAPAQPVRRGRAAVNWAIAGLVGLSVGVGVTYWISGADSEAAPMTVRQLTFRNGDVGVARFAPDGQVIVYGAAWDDEPYRLFTTRRDGYQSRPLDLPPADLFAVSADSRLALSMDRQPGNGWVPSGVLAEVPLAGGAPRPVAENVVAVDYGPDGELAAIVRRVDGRSQLEFPVGSVIHEATEVIGLPRVSPNGTHVCFQQRWRSMMLAEAGGTAYALAEDLPRVNSCAWSPDGEEIWFTYSPEDATHSNLEAVNLDGQNRRVLAALPAFAELRDVSADGTVLIAAGSMRFAVRGAPSSEVRERDLSVYDASRAAHLDPTGHKIIITDNSTGARDSDGTLFLRQLDGSAPIEIASAADVLGVFPDGTWVAVVADEESTEAEQNVITLISTATGATNSVQLPVEVRASQGNFFGTAVWEVRYSEFSEDGRRLLLPAGRDASDAERAYVHDLEEGWTRPVTPEGVTGPVVLSPDGRFVASNEEDGLSIYAVDTDERREVPGGPDPGRLARWSADGGALYIIEPEAASARLYRRDLATGERSFVREVRAPDPAGVTRFDLYVARDGEAYAYTLDRWLTNLFLLENIR